MLVRKLAILLNDVVVIEADQDIVSCPGAVESAVRIVVASDHPQDSPLRAGPTAQEKLLVFGARIRSAQLLSHFLSCGFPGLDEIQVELLHGSRVAVCTGRDAKRQHEAALAKEGRRDHPCPDNRAGKAAPTSLARVLEPTAANSEFNQDFHQ